MSTQLMRSSHDRADYGCMITFERDDGLRLTVHRTGPPLKGLRQACAIALAHDESYRVISYSTPETIYGDLKGRLAGASLSGATHPECLEARMLTRIGMRAMLHERLVLMVTGRTSDQPHARWVA